MDFIEASSKLKFSKEILEDENEEKLKDDKINDVAYWKILRSKQLDPEFCLDYPWLMFDYIVRASNIVPDKIIPIYSERLFADVGKKDYAGSLEVTDDNYVIIPNPIFNGYRIEEDNIEKYGRKGCINLVVEKKFDDGKLDFYLSNEVEYSHFDVAYDDDFYYLRGKKVYNFLGQYLPTIGLDDINVAVLIKTKSDFNVGHYSGVMCSWRYQMDIPKTYEAVKAENQKVKRLVKTALFEQYR